MFIAEPFQIFGFEHNLTIFLIIFSCLFFPFLLRNLNSKKLDQIGRALALIIITNEAAKPFYYPALYPNLFIFLNCLPFHLCNLASIFISIFLLTRNRFFFNMSFFWGISGVGMALTQPDYPYDFPHLHFILFNFSHGALLFAICFASIALKNRPNLESLKQAIIFSIPISICVYIINVSINYFAEGSPANYWYLIDFPLGENITRFMPDPPFHVLVFMTIALTLFLLTYLPFYLKDKFFSVN